MAESVREALNLKELLMSLEENNAEFPSSETYGSSVGVLRYGIRERSK